MCVFGFVMAHQNEQQPDSPCVIARLQTGQMRFVVVFIVLLDFDIEIAEDVWILADRGVELG